MIMMMMMMMMIMMMMMMMMKMMIAAIQQTIQAIDIARGLHEYRAHDDLFPSHCSQR
jgi:hypothetical protein